MSNAVAQRSMMALFDPQVWRVLREQASVLFNCQFFAKTIKSPEQAIAVIMKGYELSIPPLQACGHIFLVNGRLTCSAELQLALIYRDCPGATIDFLKIDNDSCVILAARPGHKPIEFKFTMADAKTAGLTGKDNWKNYPRSMCRSRCVSEMARTLFADAINGMSHTPEELDPETPFDPTHEAPIVLPAAQKPQVGLPPARLFDPTRKGSEKVLEKLAERFPDRTFDSHYRGRLANEILAGKEIKPGFLEQGVKELDAKINEEIQDKLQQLPLAEDEIPAEMEITL